MRNIILTGVVAMTLVGCSSAPTGPTEQFGDASISQAETEIEIMRSLAIPTTLQTLPTPTPGGTNRAEN